MKIEIFGDNFSGNCLKVKWTAEQTGMEFDWIETSVVAGEARTDAFRALNPKGLVPIIRLDDGRVLAESNAIITFLADISGSDLLPKDPWVRAKVNEWLFWEQYSHEPTIARRRFRKAFLGKSDQELDPALLTDGLAALTRLDEALSGKEFLVEGLFTIADISLVAYTRMAEDGGYPLGEYPEVRSWIKRVEGRLGLQPYPGYKSA